MKMKMEISALPPPRRSGRKGRPPPPPPPWRGPGRKRATWKHLEAPSGAGRGARAGGRATPPLPPSRSGGPPALGVPPRLRATPCDSAHAGHLFSRAPPPPPPAPAPAPASCWQRKRGGGSRRGAGGGGSVSL